VEELMLGQIVLELEEFATRGTGKLSRRLVGGTVAAQAGGLAKAFATGVANVGLGLAVHQLMAPQLGDGVEFARTGVASAKSFG
jgi:hypothetical protein